jgi:hypothetical protein
MKLASANKPERPSRPASSPPAQLTDVGRSRRGVGMRRLPPAVTKSEMEFEIEFAHDGDSPGIDKYHVHVRCFAAWEFERNKPPQS